MDLPPNTAPEVAQKFKEFRDSIEFSNKTCKSKIYGPTGFLVWEDSEEDYQKRMNELFYEVKRRIICQVQMLIKEVNT